MSDAVDLLAERTIDRLHLRVTDTGIGPDQLTAVFETFGRVDEPLTRRPAGLGLGSRFVLRLPIAHLPFEDSHPVREDSFPPIDSLAAARVLIVDDDADHLDLMTVASAQADAAVFSAASPADALKVLSSTPVDVLVSDLAIPGEDGWSVISSVRQGLAARSIPAIAVSACVSEMERRRSINAAFNRHLPKSVDMAALRRAIHELAPRKVA